MKRFEVCCMGESLLDITGSGVKGDPKSDNHLYLGPGGGVSNVAIGLARLGTKVSLITKFGDDALGRYLTHTLKDEGIDVSGITISREYPTSIVLVELDRKAQPKFALYGYPGADNVMEPADIRESIIKNSRFLHFSSVTMVHKTSRAATLRAVKLARKHGLQINFDTNIRLHMWKNNDQARKQVLKYVKLSHILKVNLEEARFITGKQAPKSMASAILDMGPALVALTMGAKGAALAWEGGFVECGALPIRVKDTTGAGDAFSAGLIRALIDKGWPSSENNSIFYDVLEYAMICSSISASMQGSAASMPDTPAVKTRLKRYREVRS